MSRTSKAMWLFVPEFFWDMEGISSCAVSFGWVGRRVCNIFLTANLQHVKEGSSSSTLDNVHRECVYDLIIEFRYERINTVFYLLN